MKCMEDFIKRMGRILHTFIHFPYFLILMLFNKVNEATFDQKDKIIKEKMVAKGLLNK